MDGGGGFSYPAAARLIGGAAANWWEFDGSFAREGVDPLELPLGRLLSTIYAWFTRGISDADELQKFNAELVAPLRGGDPDRVSDRVAEQELELFEKAMRGQR
jgi:hypothetical protein